MHFKQMTKIKKIIYCIYFITLMPYIDRDRYFTIICDESERFCEEYVKELNRRL